MSWLLFDSFSSSSGAPAATPPGAYARMLAALLPPGRLWRLIGESLLSSLLAGSADELERLQGRALTLLAESDPARAAELLPEYERELGLDSTGTTEERVARVVARTIARQGYRPEDLRTALAPLLGLAPADVEVLERTASMAAALGDPREIFRFFVYRDPALSGAYYLAAAQALVDAIKPSHTIGHAIESIDFACDDPYSLCDSDLLGA